MQAYRFDGFLLRPAVSTDMELASRWTYADAHHKHTTLPEFWLLQTSAVNSYVLDDECGTVFFFRIDQRKDKQCEVHIQFEPGEALRKSRTRLGLIRGILWLEKMLTESGFEGYYFHSISPQLIFFCQRKLGFEWDGTKIYRNIRRRDGGALDTKGRTEDGREGHRGEVRQGH